MRGRQWRPHDEGAVKIPKTMAEIAREVRVKRRLMRQAVGYKVARDEDGWSFETEDGRVVCTSREVADMAAELFRQKELSPEERAKEFANTRMADVAVVVVDKSLLEDGRFEAGISYVMEELKPKDKDMIWVYDKFGEKRQYFRNRFTVVFE